MQRQKRHPLSVRSLRQAVSMASLVRPAANNNLPLVAQLIIPPSGKPHPH